MNPIKPTTKRALKARSIHQNTYIVTIVVGVLIGFACLFLSLLALHWLGWSDVGGGIGILAVIIVMPAFNIAQNRAARALRESGLLREETETTARTGAIAAGEPLELRETTLWARLAIVAFWVVLMLVCAWLIINSLDKPLYLGICGLGIVVFGAVILLMAFNIKRPELLVNDEGITDCQSLLVVRFVSWDSIAVMERQRVWGLPPDYSFEENPSETVTLKDAQNEMVLTLHAANPGVPISPDKQRVIAEVGRRLTATRPIKTGELRI